MFFENKFSQVFYYCLTNANKCYFYVANCINYLLIVLNLFYWPYQAFKTDNHIKNDLFKSKRNYRYEYNNDIRNLKTDLDSLFYIFRSY